MGRDATWQMIWERLSQLQKPCRHAAGVSRATKKQKRRPRLRGVLLPRQPMRLKELKTGLNLQGAQAPNVIAALAADNFGNIECLSANLEIKQVVGANFIGTTKFI